MHIPDRPGLPRHAELFLLVSAAAAATAVRYWLIHFHQEQQLLPLDMTNCESPACLSAALIHFAWQSGRAHIDRFRFVLFNFFFFFFFFSIFAVQRSGGHEGLLRHDGQGAAEGYDPGRILHFRHRTHRQDVQTLAHPGGKLSSLMVCPATLATSSALLRRRASLSPIISSDGGPFGSRSTVVVVL